MSHAINEIARLERRSAAAVLREIAGEADYRGPWVRVVKAGAADVRVTVGSRVLCVERVDGQELAPEEHRAALAEALGAAVTALDQRGDRYATTDPWGWEERERALKSEIAGLRAAAEEARLALPSAKRCAQIADEYTGGVNHLRERREIADRRESRRAGEKTPIQQRADEQEAASEGVELSFDDLIRNARIALSDAALSSDDAVKRERRLDADGWLEVARRRLAREAAR